MFSALSHRVGALQISIIIIIIIQGNLSYGGMSGRGIRCLLNLAPQISSHQRTDAVLHSGYDVTAL